VAWYDWIVLALSLGFLSAYASAVWRSARPGWRSAPAVGFDPNRPYQAYCRDFDVEVDWDKLDETLALKGNSITEERLAKIAKDLDAWRARYERAVLEAAARIRSTLSQDAIDDTVVSLLVDHSGSMRGLPVSLGAKAVLTASELLEALRAKQEMLGFTTVRWRGGLSREKWLEAGGPLYPGRLNDILHIVYCGAGEKPNVRHFATMMREEILKENVDGEAVEWAASRLRQRPESRKYLIVISDGAPVDDSTLAVNPGTYLENHLRGVIEGIAKAGDIRLAAIGLGYDVGRYYERSVTVRTLDDDLGQPVLRLLEQLLCAPRAAAQAVEP
jgi:cobaltochelatase CobT